MRLKFTKLLLCLTILSAPLYVIRFHIGPFPTTLLEVLILLTTFSWLLKSRFKIFYLRFTNYELPIFIFLLSALIAILVSPDKHGTVGAFKAYIIEPIFIYIITRSVIKTREDTNKIIAAMIASGVFISLWVVVQAAFGWFIISPHEAALGRAHGPYNTANAVGLYLGPIFALALASLPSVILSEAKDPLNKILRLSTSSRLKVTMGMGIIALLLTAIFLSKSAGALLATIAVIFCFFLFNNSFRLPFTIYCLLSLVFIFAIVPHLTPKTSWTKARPENYNTTTIRLCLWEGTRRMLLERPIFGTGLSGFKELYAEKYTTCDSEPFEYPHNLILNFWTEMGILGVISFMWLVWKALKTTAFSCHSELVSESSRFRSGKMLKRVQHDNIFRMGITLALIYILIHGLVDVPYFKNDLALQFWLLLALSEF